MHNFSDDAGSYSSLALDLAGNPHIAYLDISSFETLGYAYHDGTWNYDNTADRRPVGGHISLALADDLYPRISYYDMVNDALLYAARDGTWSITEVNGPGEGGVYTSLALDAANQPHISYYAQSTEELRYAHLVGSTWISETVAVPGGSQVHTSLALDASDRPHIAYYDELNYNLGYATLTGLTGQPKPWTAAPAWAATPRWRWTRTATRTLPTITILTGSNTPGCNPARPPRCWTSTARGR